MLAFYLYGFEDWSFTLRKKHQLSFLEDRVQKRIFDLTGTRLQTVEETT
jgi:hypothetical protein